MAENTQKIIMVRDESENGEVFGLYDISNMSGDVKDYYKEGFESYDAYEEDMLERGAISIPYQTLTV